jgi:hypothetical protein
MIDLMVEHGGWIDAGSVGYIRNVELARRMLQGEIDPHLESGAFSGKTVEAILWERRERPQCRRSCAWRWSGSTGRGTTRDGSGCSGVRCPGIRT